MLDIMTVGSEDEATKSATVHLRRSKYTCGAVVIDARAFEAAERDTLSDALRTAYFVAARSAPVLVVDIDDVRGQLCCMEHA